MDDHDDMYCPDCVTFPCSDFWPPGTVWGEAMASKVLRWVQQNSQLEFEQGAYNKERPRMTKAQKKIHATWWTSTVPVQHMMNFPDTQNRGFGPPPKVWKNPLRMDTWTADMNRPEKKMPVPGAQEQHEVPLESKRGVNINPARVWGRDKASRETYITQEQCGTPPARTPFSTNPHGTPHQWRGFRT
jgi:hypothetical protein